MERDLSLRVPLPSTVPLPLSHSHCRFLMASWYRQHYIFDIFLLYINFL